MSIVSKFKGIPEKDRGWLSVLALLTILIVVGLSVLNAKLPKLTPEEKAKREQAYANYLAVHESEEKRRQAELYASQRADRIYQLGEEAYPMVQNMAYVKNEESGRCYGVIYYSSAHSAYVFVREDCDAVKAKLWKPKK